MADLGAVATLSQVVGANCRRIRLGLGATQSQVAAACVQTGLVWGHRRVAQLEAGEAAATLPTLLRLAAALDVIAGGTTVSVVDLLRWDGLVVLADGETVPGELLAAVVTGTATAGTLAAHLHPADTGEGGPDGRLRARSGWGRADERAARRLGLNREAMIALTHHLWGQGLEAERDRRAAAAGVDGNRTGRAWITSALEAQLREALNRPQ